MIQPEENNDDKPVFHLDLVKNRIGPVPKSVRQLYRVGNRLLTDAECLSTPKRTRGGKNEMSHRQERADSRAADIAMALLPVFVQAAVILMTIAQKNF